MKIFLLFAFLLIIVNVKAININAVEDFKQLLEKCEENSPLGKIADVPHYLRSDIIYCALKTNGSIDKLDYYGAEIFENTCNTYTIDPIQCQRIMFSCYQVVKINSPINKFWTKPIISTFKQGLNEDRKEVILKYIRCITLHGGFGLIPF